MPSDTELIYTMLKEQNERLDEQFRQQNEVLREQSRMLSEQQQSITRIETRQEDGNKRLFGNGQPGIIQFMAAEYKRIEGKLDEKVKELSDRDTSLNTRLTWYAGVAAGLGFALNYLLKPLLAKIFHFHP